MRRVRLLPLLVVLGASAPAAQATATPRAPQPLVRVAPVGPVHVADRVLGARAATRAVAASVAGAAYQAPDGTTIHVGFSPSYTPDTTTAQSYVNYLATLPHGAELGRLQLLLETPDEVVRDCGGAAGTLACYSGATHLMIVPGEQIADQTGVSTSYVIAHEYGHHIASFRSNAPFSALDFGPKYWSSYEGVCAGVLAKQLFPGAEDTSQYVANPGESWAETYARLVYPQQPWTFTPLLAPDAGSLAAARRDVATPWTGPVKRTFRGRFAANGPATRRFSFALNLDGSLRVALRGPRRADYDLRLTALGRTQGATRGHGARDVLSYQAACRQQQSERVTVTVTRRAGSGAFTLTATYAG